MLHWDQTLKNAIKPLSLEYWTQVFDENGDCRVIWDLKRYEAMKSDMRPISIEYPHGIGTFFLRGDGNYYVAPPPTGINASPSDDFGTFPCVTARGWGEHPVFDTFTGAANEQAAGQPG